MRKGQAMKSSTVVDFSKLKAPEPMSAPDIYPKALLDLPVGAARDSLLTVHAILERDLPPGNLEVYEAGGGSTSFLPLGVRKRARTTVVDIDSDQIANNDYAEVKVLGDIQTHRFKPHSFDLVTCYNVIEHLEDVQSALLRFCECLRPGGLILIGAPNPRSLSGVVTKFTPHWFHVAFYRYVLGDKKAGLPGQAPFPTHFHPLVTLPRLLDFAREHGLEPQYVHRYESPRFPEMRIRWPWLAGAIDGVAAILNALLMHRIDVRHGDYHVILRKT
jgi:SAM-dependent methyltransferase